MKLFACGEAQKVSSPGEFLDVRTFAKIVGVTDLGRNNGGNDFGWSGVKAVVSIDREHYILDFPEALKIETDDGLELMTGDAMTWLDWQSSLLEGRDR